MKNCYTCHNLLPSTEFKIQPLHKTGLSSSCKKCINKRSVKNKSKIKLEAIASKGYYCQTCYTKVNPYALAFHHRDPNLKIDRIARLIRENWSHALSEELDKCDLICFNCHRELHFKESLLKKRPQHKLNAILKSRKAKEMLVEYMGGGCSLCHYNKCMAALDFHHQDPSIKTMNIGTYMHRMNELNTNLVLKELENCHLLCANCHQGVTNGLMH